MINGMSTTTSANDSKNTSSSMLLTYMNSLTKRTSMKIVISARSKIITLMRMSPLVLWMMYELELQFFGAEEYGNLGHHQGQVSGY